MGISGNYVGKFSEANLASAVDVHMNGDYHFFFDVVSVETDLAGDGMAVTLRPHSGGGGDWQMDIKRKNGREFVTYVHKGAYTSIFGGKGEVVKVVPFKGKVF